MKKYHKTEGFIVFFAIKKFSKEEDNDNFKALEVKCTI